MTAAQNFRISRIMEISYELPKKVGAGGMHLASDASPVTLGAGGKRNTTSKFVRNVNFAPRRLEQANVYRQSKGVFRHRRTQEVDPAQSISQEVI